MENGDHEKFRAMKRRGHHREWGERKLGRKVRVVLHVYVHGVGT